MHPLRNTIRPYAWGSRTVIADLQGRPSPSEDPEAEMWIGAHPGGPSRLAVRGSVDGLERGLDEVIAADPDGLLGADVASRFGGRLPYLLKYLAAERPLSLQAHPDAEQAAAGFAAEEAAGVPLDAAWRKYVDASHKPELLVAVSDFEALCGFRPPEQAADVLAAFRVPALDPVIGVLRGSRSPEDRLRDAVHQLMAWPVDGRAALVGDVAKAADGGWMVWGDRAAGERVAAGFGLAKRLADEYPGDVGVIVALLLNHVRLRAGEGVWMPAGNLHAYLQGAGVEIMAASDNVLRGGLTPKHVDVDELLRVLRFDVLHDPVMRSELLSDGPAGKVSTWPTPVAEFRLTSADVMSPSDAVAPVGGGVVLPVDGPRSIFCARGHVTLRAGDETLALSAGQAAFVPAHLPAVEVTGDGEVFQAGTP
jgi:mannose-6-phosphate isomerase